MKGVWFREMRVSDIPEVARIERESFSTPWSEVSFFQEVNNPVSTCLVAESGDLLVGYVCASLTHGEGHILTLAVRPGWRRRGIGKALVEAVLEELSRGGCRVVMLEVRASNTPARRLYESMGFRTAGLRRGYYRFPVEDAVLMELTLKDDRGRPTRSGR